MSKSFITRKDFLKLLGSVAGIGALSYYLGLRDHPMIDSAVDDPDYLDMESAFPVFRGPYMQKDAQLAAFLFPVELKSLVELCDRTLNAVPNSAFEYVPLMSNVLMIYADMLVSSMDERDAKVGLIPETEVGFWMLTVAMQKSSTGSVPHHLAWFIPYLLVDEGNAIATGREVYGFNKQAASFDKAPDIQSPQFRLDILGFEHFAPDAIAKKQNLLKVFSPSPKQSERRWRNWQVAKSDLSGMFLPYIRNDMGEEIIAFVAQAALENIPLVFLKQFRHATKAQKACYQRIVEAPLQLQTFHSGGFFSEPYELELLHLESHPLAQRLGLQAQQVSRVGVWLKVDFVLGLGVEYQPG